MFRAVKDKLKMAFGQLPEKRPCGHVTDSGIGFQYRRRFGPSWGKLDGVAGVVVDRLSWSTESLA